ncbi:hypothetical protein LX32DRAFT_730904 [Colletotrichum zoysiae]|uniref:Small nuclear ribonucleoprotein Prp3 C-terminal domain-containing protein n=1 Tax=Colletotrichum zoysiae TaxID=1216348 RepID=A0AAD9HA50_9PEZI|nr:hypothetical protein LX32DRAFT_730904 [Colletotrichum zoysiae]
MAASPPWSLLPTDVVEHQVGQIDLLTAMYPAEGEVAIEGESERTLSLLRSLVEDPSSSPPSFAGPPQVTILLTLAIAREEEEAEEEEEEEGSPKPETLQLDIGVPFAREAKSAAGEEEEEDEEGEGAPRIRVRIRQPAWLSRAATARLNAKVPEGGVEDLFGAIEAVKDAAAAERLERARLTEAAAAAAAAAAGGEDEPLVRVWFYFPSISTRSKRDDLVAHAPARGLTGFLYAGKPGLLCLEGGERAIDGYMSFIRTESWGDIPARHKKVSERLRERGVAARAFAGMSEVTGSVGGGRRGQRANRGDMGAVEAWLAERGLGDAFAKVLM